MPLSNRSRTKLIDEINSSRGVWLSDYGMCMNLVCVYCHVVKLVVESVSWNIVLQCLYADAKPHPREDRRHLCSWRKQRILLSASFRVSAEFSTSWIILRPWSCGTSIAHDGKAHEFQPFAGWTHEFFHLFFKFDSPCLFFLQCIPKGVGGTMLWLLFEISLTYIYIEVVVPISLS